MPPTIPLAAHRRHLASRVNSLAILLALGACAPGSDLLAPENPTTLDSETLAVLPVGAAVSEEQLLEILHVTLDDEYRAEAIYLGVMQDFGPILPFRNIAKAERQHAKNVLTLYAARALPAPANPWTPRNVPHFASRTEACQAGVTAEIENVALYDRLLALALPADVQSVLVRNRLASLKAHLPAFKRCS